MRGQIAAYVGERDEQRARADASDALAAARLEERALAEAALQVVEKQLKVEVQARESVERRLAEEVKAQVPLKAQLAQLADVQAEAARFQMAAQKASAELPPLLEAIKRLELQVQQAEVISNVLREDKGALEKEVSVTSLKLDAKTREVEKLANELRIERNKSLEMKVVQVQAETKKESKFGALLERVLKAEQEREAIEKRALAAEREAAQVKQEVQQVQQETIQVSEAKGELQLELDQVRAQVSAERSRVEHLELELEGERLATAKAKLAAEGALIEAAGAREQTVRVVDELAVARTDARDAREALDAVKLSAFRKVDQLKTEITEITAGKEAAEAEVLSVREAEALAKARITSLEAEIQKMRLVGAQLELTHQTQLLNQQEAQRLEREALEAHQATELQHHVEEAALLREVLDSASTLMASFELMRAEVANLTADNECYVAERRQLEDALSCRFELRSTCSTVEAVGFMLEDPLAVDLVSQLALQCEQQRALDATERDLAEALGCFDTLVAFCRDELQPEANAAWLAVQEMPRLREDLLQAGMVHSDGMAQLQRARDEAEAERRRLLDEVAVVNAKLAKVSEQAAYTTELQASQLTQLTMDFTECNEELQNWRTGNIRLANARQWREEREKAKAGGGSSGGPPVEGGGVEASPPPAAASA